MKVIKPQRLGVLHRVLEHRQQVYFSVGILAIFGLDEPEVLLNEQDFWPFVAREMAGVSPTASFDDMMPKKHPELLVTGKAFPSKRPAPVCDVRVQVGPIDKTLRVFGQRHWLNKAPSDPAPFEEMPVTYRNAFGGDGYTLNPLGKGFAPPEERGAPHFLANIEDVKKPVRSPNDRPAPAGFGAYDVTWPQRQDLLGTLDARWQQDAYPGYPDDMDWAMFNTAQDQRLKVFRGDESIRIENMHPDRPLIESALPGIQTRCFVTQKAPDGQEVFREISMALETVHLFPHADRAVALFRGTLLITDEFADDILHLVIAGERLGQARPFEHYQDVLDRRLDRKTAHLFALREDQLLPEGMKELPRGKGTLQREGLFEANQQRRAEAELEQARERLRQQGIDPDAHLPRELPKPEPAPSFEGLASFIEQKKAEVEAQAKQVELDAEKLCGEQGLDYQGLKSAQQDKAGGPPKSVKKELDRVRKLLGDTDLPEVQAQLRDPALVRQLLDADAQLRSMYVQYGHHMTPAPDLEEAVRQRLRHEVVEGYRSGESFQDRDLTGASLKGLDLRGADFRGALLEGADLSGAVAREADFTGAVLTRANLTSADLRGAKLDGANLGHAGLVSTRAGTATLRRVVLHAAVFEDADLSGSDLTGADLSGATFLRTDFSEVLLPGALFLDSDLSGLILQGADLTKSTFVRAVLTGTDFSGAKLADALFLTVKATGTIWRDTDLTAIRVVQDSVFRDADFRGAKMARASMRATCLVGAVFTGVLMEGADFTGSDLQGANLRRVIARGARFQKSNLAGADLSGGDFMEALLGGANLRGTNLSDSHLYGADLLRADVDQGTSVEGAETVNARFRVRRAS